MNIPREIIFENKTVEDAVTSEQLAEVETILVDTLFSLWLQEKGFISPAPKLKITTLYQKEK
jgi:hypothetical protein